MIFLTNEDLPSRHNFVLFFYTQEMPFYHKMIHYLSSLEDRCGKHELYAVDANYFVGLCKRFAVQHVPQFILFQDRQEVKRLSQTVRTADVRQFLADICIL